ncbi:BamA/TamA family outer membrane protein [Winogradskyella ursingii]|uniref:hypothetical protein n=1 Tax=Winogradskyella ursingii TaxID=2686079 RepID=UPI001C54981D|nr:hypothetical protein [Winogradskyella ursingii]
MIENARIVFVIFLLTITNQSIGQSIHLKIEAETETNSAFIDSLGYSKVFDNYKNLESEIAKLKSKLTKQGYIDNEIDSIIKKNDTLFSAQFTLGKRINSIRIYFDSNFNVELLKLINHKLGENFFEVNIPQLENSLTQLNSKIAEKGDPFSTLQLIDFNKLDSTLISAQLIIINNQKRRIDGIVVKGYEKFPKSYVKRFLKLRKYKSFNLNDIKKKVELLEDLPFANKIKDPEVLFTKDSTILYIYVEKTRSNNFDGFLGFGTNEQTNKIEFDGYLDLRLVNNLNFGESLNLFYKSDEIDQLTFRVDAKLPYLFTSPIGIDVGLNIFRQDSTFSNVTQKLKVNYQINPKHQLGIGILGVTSTNLLENETNQLNDYSSRFYTLSYSFINPQYYDPLFPINFYFDFSTGFGDRTNNLGQQDQSVFNLETYKIFNLNNRNSVFARVNSAILVSDDYLDNELFRFGGINSIRGFEENSLVADLYGVINTEYRYRLSNSIYVHSVFDFAYFENKLSDLKTKLFGFGFGFGLLTNAGLFKLNYSSGKTENRPFKLSDSKVHLSLTATF